MNKKTIAIIAGIIIVFGIIMLCVLPGSDKKENKGKDNQTTTIETGSETSSETGSVGNSEKATDETPTTDKDGNVIVPGEKKQFETSENGAFIIEDEGDSDSGNHVDFDDLFGDGSKENSKEDETNKSKTDKNSTDKNTSNKNNSNNGGSEKSDSGNNNSKNESVTGSDGSVSDNNSTDNSEEETVKKEDETKKSEATTSKKKELVGEDNTEEGYIDLD